MFQVNRVFHLTHLVEDHDAAVGRLVTTLRLTGRDADTTLTFSGSVTDDRGQPVAGIPFDDRRGASRSRPECRSGSAPCPGSRSDHAGSVRTPSEAP